MTVTNKMFSTFQEQDYSSADIPSVSAELDSKLAKMEERFPGQSFDDLCFKLHKQKAKVLKSDELLSMIQQSASQKRNTFTEYFVLSDLKTEDAVIRVEGGHITSDDDYPGCLTYESANDRLDPRDVLLLKDVATKCGKLLQFRDKFYKSDDILVSAGFENDDGSYWFNGFDSG